MQIFENKIVFSNDIYKILKGKNNNSEINLITSFGSVFVNAIV